MLCRMALMTLSFTAFTVSPRFSPAQTREEWRAASEGKQETQPLVLDQSYHGVTPGTGNTLPRVAELKGKSGNWVTWPGFTMLENGASRIFVQTTSAIEYEIVKKKNTLVLKLKDSQVFLTNNRNPLVTVNFNTPIERAYLKVRKKKVELVLELKVPSEPTITQTVDKDGYAYVFVDFAAGQYPIEEKEARPSFAGHGSPKTDTGAESPPPAPAPETGG
jgi:hypothetical protein